MRTPSRVCHAQHRAGLIDEGAATLPVVPTQAISALVLAALAAWSYRRIATGKSSVFVPGLVAYSVFHFAIELVRDDPARNAIGPLSTSQWIAALVVAACALWTYLRSARTPGQARVTDMTKML